MSYNKVQLTHANDYKSTNLIFQEPVSGAIPNSSISFQRIPIKIKYPDGKYGDLILPTETLFSFGVSETLNPMTQQVNGYTLPLCLHNRDGVTDAEKKWVAVFQEIVEQCKNHVIANRNKFPGKYDLEMSELKKFCSSSFYWKRDPHTGENDPQGPTLYPKLIVSKKDGNEVIKSLFYDADTQEPLDPMLLKKKYCYATSAVKIESIFIGSKISLQIKLWETELSLLDKGITRLLRPGSATKKVEEKVEETAEYSEEEFDSEVEADAGSIENSDEESEEEPAPVRRRVVAKK